jgi:hypothetical protein
MSTSVHYFHSGMPGAPVLNGTAGTMLAVLDACLINGWGASNADSVTISGGIATLIRAAGHSAEVGSVVLIAGATVTGGDINGERRVLTAASDRYTFDATGIPNQTATGTINQRIAPVGWTKPFSATDLAVYRAPDVTGNRFFLRVDDSEVGNARVRGYETMSDANTGTGLFPKLDSHPGAGGFWARGADTTTPSPWVIVADGKTLYYAANYYASSYSNPERLALVGVFGDVVKVGSTDQFASVILCPATERRFNAPGGSSWELDYRQVDSTSFNLARAHHGIGLAVQASNGWADAITPTNAYKSGANVLAMPFPNSSDGGIYIAPVVVFENATRVLRGTLPGLFAFPQNVTNLPLQHNGYLTGVAGYPGKTFRTLNSQNGCWAFDMSGPWQ